MKLFKKKYVKISKEDLNTLLWYLNGIGICAELIKDNIEDYSNEPELLHRLVLARVKEIEEDCRNLKKLYNDWDNELDF